MSSTCSKRCYLIYWDNSRLENHPRFKQYIFPILETIAPSKLTESSLKMIMQSIIVARSPLSLIDKVNASRSFQSGQPIFTRTSSGLACSLTRLELRAQLVEDLVIKFHSEEHEEATWTEPRRVRYEGDDDTEIEVLPRRKRHYDSRTNVVTTIQNQ